VPPLFNRPEYGVQTAGYIVDPPACGAGEMDLTEGSDSLLTHWFYSTATNSNELRFAWVDTASTQAWARIMTSKNSGATVVTPIFQNPIVHLVSAARSAWISPCMALRA